MSFRLLTAAFCKMLLLGSCVCAAVLPSVQAQGGGRTVLVSQAAEPPPSLSIRRKLAGIILPSVELHQVTLGDALEFLRQESRRLDPDPNPQTRGVNFLLKLPAVPSPNGTTGPDANPSVGTNPTQVAAAPPPTAGTRVTLTMSHLPLLEAVRYLAKEAGLTVRVEPYAVTLAPLAEDAAPLLDATFRVSPGFIPNQSTGGTGGALNQAATGAR